MFDRNCAYKENIIASKLFVITATSETQAVLRALQVGPYPAILDGRTWSKVENIENTENMEKMKNINQMT